MSTTANPQISMYEKTVEDATLEAALEARFKLVEQRKALNKRLKEADGHARTLLEPLELGDGSVVRVGRFLVSRRKVASREVSFSTDPTTRLQISLLPES